MSENLNVPNFDPAWDYASVAETLLSLDATRKELGDILSEEQAEVGNLSTDEKILSCILKIEGDCKVIRKAIDDQFVDERKPSRNYESANLCEDNSLEAISENLRQACGYLARISIKLSDIYKGMPEQ